MTPIERACRALAELHGRDPDEPVLLTDRRLWQEFEPQVRAVIAAIREPSEAMLVAAARSRTDPERFAGSDADDTLTPEWCAMIDKMLEEGRDGSTH